ncbi:MAG: helix-turn-helix transcriptional regulator [Atopobiaceae bacterium]|nr:helix-turn-helix transcriptional regulator [Atopobiaceae bacterium]
MTEQERIFREMYALHLKTWMEENGVTQGELADALGCHKMTVWMWVSGKSMPSTFYATKIRRLMARWPGRRRNGQVE